jgi:hypothetical protein
MEHCADAVLVARPDGFGFNPETASTNSFQQSPGAGDAACDVTASALREYQNAVRALRDAGVTVHELLHDEPGLTDAVFPNNWFSTHPGGRLVLYPMLSPNRRRERRALSRVVAIAGSCEIVDLTCHEEEGRYLEGTGSIVFDHASRLAYAALSARTHSEAFACLCKRLGYEPVSFRSHASGQPVYHTNVLLAIGEKVSVLCADVVAPEDREELRTRLDARGDLILIDEAQLGAFCGNVLQLATRTGERAIVMSSTAHDAFTPDQRGILTRHGRFCVLDIPTIERYGGGSARCMLAELF